MRTLRLPVLAVSAAAILVAGLASAPGTAAATTGGGCTEYSVPVALTENGPEDYTIVGDLCLPAGETTTVQLLVHGGTYNRAYWDFPYQPQLYSYARIANHMGYATFNVDSLGTGESSHPHSDLVDPTTTAKALHDVITKLRAGAIGSVAYDKVIWVGHSLGVVMGWVEASTYNDVDAFIATGATHSLSLSAVGPIAGAQILASTDPKFTSLNLDSGYVALTQAARGTAFYNLQTSSQQVRDVDWDLRDVLTNPIQYEGLPLFTIPAQDSPTLAFTMPVLSVLGSKDFLFCGEDALDCDDQQAVYQNELAYYPNASSLDVVITPETGHDLNLHYTAPFTYITMLNWAKIHAAP